MGGYYYLHTETKDLILKKFCPNPSSPLVKCIWPVDFFNRDCLWTIVLESLALGAKPSRIIDLANKWNLSFEDSFEMLKRINPTVLMRIGMVKFVPLVFNLEIDDYWNKVKEKMKGEKKKNENV